MKERPILFSAPMVQAILAGKKFQTRRVVRIDDRPILATGREQRGIPANAENVRLLPGCYLKCDSPPGSGIVSSRVPCPYGWIEDRLWVRETWYDNCCRTNGETGTHSPNGEPWIYYRADGMPDFDGDERDMKWRPSIFMPRWASRITLEIESLRVSRLQDIGEEDAQSEGIWFDGEYWRSVIHPVKGSLKCWPTARIGFEKLWDSINGERPGCSWESNPYVWVIAFHRLETNNG